MPASPLSRFGRYWPVWLTLVAGMAATVWLARGLYREGERLDRQRFKVEASALAALLEANMERYEELLARLADHCAQFDELPWKVWSFRLDKVTDLDVNLPAVVLAAYCRNIKSNEFATHAAKNRETRGEGYQFDPEPRIARALALPVWQRWARAGIVPLPLGTDMAEEASGHPSLQRGLDHESGGVCVAPARVARKDGSFENGFWFTLALHKPDQARFGGSQRPGEPTEDFQRRADAYYRRAAIGILAAFISTDRLVDGSFNNPKPSPRLHLRLYASREPEANTLLNPLSQPPGHPRHREIIVQPWYGRRWALEFTSTPQFESDAATYRSGLVLWAGAGMTALASALLGVALRARNRQEQLTEQIREARDALLAAEQQRQKLSHDLHDNTIQSLYAVQLGLGHTAQKLDVEFGGAGLELSAVRSELNKVIAEIRRYIMAGESIGQDVDFGEVLRDLMERARAGTTAQIEVRCDPGAAARLSAAQAIQLANIFREALSNAVRHARPQHVQIALRSEPDAVCLEVSDDGIGFDPESKTRGVGLTSMTTRTQEMGGTVDIQSAPGKGTRVVIRVSVSTPECAKAKGTDEEPNET